MARKGGHIEPNLDLKRYGLGDGWVTVTPGGVSITVHPGGRVVPLADGHRDYMTDDTRTMMLDPEQAPLFRMIANRLDELAGKRNRGQG